MQFLRFMRIWPRFTLLQYTVVRNKKNCLTMIRIFPCKIIYLWASLVSSSCWRLASRSRVTCLLSSTHRQVAIVNNVKWNKNKSESFKEPAAWEKGCCSSSFSRKSPKHQRRHVALVSIKFVNLWNYLLVPVPTSSAESPQNSKDDMLPWYL